MESCPNWNLINILMGKETIFSNIKGIENGRAILGVMRFLSSSLSARKKRKNEI